MGRKKINNNFTKAYSQMEGNCQEKFGVTAGGIDEYVKRLESARFAPNRDEVLGKLSTYQNLSDRFASDPNSSRRIKDVEKADVRWVKQFGDSVKKKKDPISRYLKSAHKYAKKRKAARIFTALIILLAFAGVAVALWYFGIVKF